MAISAGTTMPLRFLRRLSGNMEPPILEFPVDTADEVWRPGDAVEIDTTPNGRVGKAAGAAATGILIPDDEGGGLVGFFLAGSAGAPSFPTAAGVQGTWTAPSSLVSLDTAIAPDTEKISVCLSLDDVIFYAHQTNGATDITAPTTAFVAATGGLHTPLGLWVGTPTGETERVMVDTTTAPTDANAYMCLPVAWVYPQMPIARGTTGLGDPNQIKMGTGGTNNPAVELFIRMSIWQGTMPINT